MADNGKKIYQDPVKLLRKLIRFNTSNPPGHERECIAWINDLFTQAEFETSVFAKDPDRPNLIARMKGEGQAPPLMLYGHVDVVPCSDQAWTCPPFEGRVSDGCVWGRGALDMKGGLAMMMSALLRAKAEGVKPAGDIVFAALSDEEAGSDYGARYLIENHAREFDGIRYAIGEFGGFPIYIGNRKFYPVQVCEKQVCWMKARLHGEGGHGSQRMTGGAMAKLGQMLTALDRHRLPVHVTPIAADMIKAMAETLPFAAGIILGRLLNPRLTDLLLNLMGEKGSMLDPLLHNTVNVTTVKGGEKVNVIPSEITVEMDGRLLPGFTPKDLISEIQQITGNVADIEVTLHDPCSAEPDMGMFNMLAEVLREADPEGTPLPFLLPAVTDARLFSRLGIQSYGFLPMNLPKTFNFRRMIHAADERIPVECLSFGADAIYRVLQRYGRQDNLL